MTTVPAGWLKRICKDEGGCWIWYGAMDSQGYGRVTFRVDGRRVWTGAHRAFYEGFVGPIPEGLDLDHLCRVRACVNPAHLEPVTRSVNLKRGEAGGLREKGPSAINAAKTHCKRGHPFNEANTYREKSGARHCRTCGREGKRREAALKRHELPHARGAAA